MTKQTAVDFLIKEIKNDQFVKSKNAKEWNELFDKAKEMEKEQHFNTWWHGISEYKPILFEQYYNETYGGNNHLCCTPIGQIKRYINCIGCDRKPLTYGDNK